MQSTNKMFTYKSLELPPKLMINIVLNVGRQKAHLQHEKEG